MKKPCRLLKRAKMRMDNYDYTLGGPYFLTLCLADRTQLFGHISEDGKLHHSKAGAMVKTIWSAMPEFNPGLILDEYIVMPDHFHAIIGFVDPTLWRGPCPATTDAPVDQAVENEIKLASVADIVRRFKTQTLKHYRQGVTESGWPTYAGQLWQRGYWDRIVRSERDLQSHREYIYNNVWKKHLDRITDSP